MNGTVVDVTILFQTSYLQRRVLLARRRGVASSGCSCCPVSSTLVVRNGQLMRQLGQLVPPMNGTVLDVAKRFTQ